MINFTDILVVIGMFALRFGVPLAITIGLAYLLKRLDRRWADEAWAQADEAWAQADEAWAQADEAWAQAEEQDGKQPAQRPAKPQQAPTVNVPFVPQPVAAKGLDVVGRQLPGMQVGWELRGSKDFKIPHHANG